MTKRKQLQRKPATAVVPQSKHRPQQSPSTTPHTITHLQRTIGNRAVGQLLLQRKMTVGPVNDQYEQEADSVAKQVIGNISSQPITQRQEDEEEVQTKRESNSSLPSISRLQRQEDEEEMQAKRLQRQEDEEEIQAKGEVGLEGSELDNDVEDKVQSAKSGGKPLDKTVRRSFENAFGTNFSGVKIHTGGQANTLNRNLNARAFTTGHDVFFRDGEYNPTSNSGKELLAHELTHVVQQTGAPQSSKTISKKPNHTIQRAIHPKVERALTAAGAQDPEMLVVRPAVNNLIEFLRDRDVISLSMQQKIIHLWDRSKKKRRGNDEELTTRMDLVRGYLINKFIDQYIYYRMQRGGTEEGVKEDKKNAYKDIKIIKKGLLDFGLDKSGSINPELNLLFTELNIPTDDNTTVNVGPRIEVRGTTIPGGGLPGKWHSFIVYTDALGKQYYIASHMAAEDDPQQPGQLKATLGEYRPGIHEWAPDADTEVLEEGASAADKWPLMMAAANGINHAQIQYKMMSTNCNRAAYHILVTAGVANIKPPGTAYAGWGKMLF